MSMPRSRKSIWKRMREAGVPQQLILAFLALLTLYPFFFMLMSSFKNNEQFYKRFWQVSFPLHFENYVTVWPSVSRLIVNSLLYSVPTLLLVCFISLLSGYAFGRFRFWGRDLLFMIMLSLLMLPGILTLIPLFILIRDLQWLDSPQAIILPWTAFQLVFATFIMRIFFERLPKEIFEAARLDGAGELRMLFAIATPLALPAIGTIAIFNLLFTWNDIVWPLVTLFDRNTYPIAVGVIGFRGEYETDFGLLFAAYTLATLPLVLAFAFMVRQFFRGLKGGLSL